MLDGKVTDMVRFKEKRATELGIKPGDDRAVDEWCSLLADNPELLERYLGDAFSAVYLMRPDQHVAARWELFDEAAVREALNIATGRT